MLSIGSFNSLILLIWNLQWRQKPFLALAVLEDLDLGNLGEYGIEVATLNSAGNKKAHRRSAQVEQCREEKVDRWRFVGLSNGFDNVT